MSKLEDPMMSGSVCGKSSGAREGNAPGRPSDLCLRRTLELAEHMLRLADEGDALRDDPGCGVLYGVLRDSAYKLQRLAEAERRAHLRKNLKQG
jgi:hypothetical protein